jgi:chromosome segregation ATPase
VDLAGAVAYWQERAAALAVERDKLQEQVARFTEERDRLIADRATLETIVTRLQGERNDVLGNAKAEATLRCQAERDLEYALITIESLNTALRKLSGPRFGVVLGATYDIRARDPAILAALQITPG